MSERSTLKVRLIHGDLRHASYPLAVGHYKDDVIVNAEAEIDAALGGALRHRFDLGIYPGDLGTSEIVFANARPPGAIVVGLGAVGELTAESLRLTFAHAFRRYALAVAEKDGKEEHVAVRCSTLLVGTDGGVLGTLADAIHAIVRGALDANRSLAQASLPRPVRIDTLQFVELYEDVAIHAGHVIRELPGPIERDLEPNEEITGAEEIDIRPGGRSFHPGNPYSAGWWQRIAVRGKPSDGTPAASAPLQFTVLSDRARLEQETSVGQRALIEQLVTSATERTNVDLELSAAMYQLVVPAHVQDRILRGGDLLFMVDRAGASYPYELMAMRTAQGPKALIDDRGVLRQFETEHFRIQPEMARADRMFLVGNPRTILFDDLTGAELEADEVEAVAKKFLAVERAPREDGERSIIKLMTGEFRILHFAAHGQFDPDPMKSGVVMSDRLRVTPAEVARLPVVPELVFLNCCYLGKMEAPRQSGPDPRLAANLAEGFIQAGVRAVIAAGWAVDDEAGRTFARTFYEEFLSGVPFGEAVKRARKEVRREHADSNTWGAYQCYGNPDYRFKRADSTRPNPPGQTAFVARNEALQALRTLASNARSMRRGDEARLQGQLEELRQCCTSWDTDGEILACCGEISAELGRFDEAIGFYRRALAAVPARAAILIVEQLANLLTRSAASLLATGTPLSEVVGHFDEAANWLQWLDSRLERSKERCALWGALYKRRAMYEDGDRKKHLTRAEAAYRKAAKLARQDPYATLNAIALRFVRSSRRELSELRRIIDERLARTPSFEHGDQDFWSIVARPDTLLLHRVIHGTLHDPAACEEVIAAYRLARAAGPSLREWASVCDQVEFLAAMLKAGMPRPDPSTATALEKVLASMRPS